MTVSEKERLALYRKLQEQLGIESADTLMEFLPPGGSGEIATRTDLHASATLLRGEMAELRGEMAEMGAQLRGEMAELRGEMAELRGEMAELRSDVRTEIGDLRGEVQQGFAAIDLRLASMQRTTLLWFLVFGLTVWVTILAGAVAG